MTSTILIRRVGVACAAMIALAAAPAAYAVITGPYTPDANTLHLYHLNETVGATTIADAGTANLTMLGVLNGVVNGAPAFTGFGSSADMSANALLPANAAATGTPVANRPIILGAAAVDAADLDTVPFSFSSAPAAGAGGAFTMEAMIKFNNTIYDPAATNFRNVSGVNGGNYAMDVIMGEGDGNGARNFQFRINQIGIATGTVANGTTRPRIEFANLHGITGNQSFAWDIPLTGTNAINNTDWFHVAVAYNGLEGAAGNLTAFWTKVVPTATTASSLGAPGSAAAFMNQDLLSANTAFSIGNEARTNGGEGEAIPGFIDEVRISAVARTASQFIFADPTPGDVNGDSVVNIADFNLITANLLKTPAVRADGDLNNDSIVDFADFRIWKLNKTSPPGQGAVPEPTSVALAVLGLLGCTSLRRRTTI